MISPIIVGVFVAVVAVVGCLAFVMRDSDQGRAATRLDILVGKRRQDAATELLKKDPFEATQQSIMQAITSRIPNLQRWFEQADCHIAPSSLGTIGLVLAILGVTGSWLAGVPVFFWPVPAMILFLIPWTWLWNKRRVRLR